MASSIHYSSGVIISSVDDQSGSTNHLTATNTVTYSATGFNTSFPAFVYVDTDTPKLMKTSFPMGTGNTITLFAVYTPTTTGNSRNNNARVLSYNAGGEAHDWDNDASFSLQRNGSSTTSILYYRNFAANTFTVTDNTPRRLIVTQKSDGTTAVYVNGSASAGSIGVHNFVTNGGFGLASSQNDTDSLGGCFNGAVAEAGVATGWHDATTIGSLDTYLKNKWGM